MQELQDRRARVADPGTAADAPAVLRRVFGFDAFRGPQQAIVEHVTAGGDALVLMPTGGGKSLCYQVPALLRDGTGLVVSPLIALMQDQVEALRQLGVRAAYLNSTLDAEQARQVERDLLDGQLDLLYVAPERLLTHANYQLRPEQPGYLRLVFDCPVGTQLHWSGTRLLESRHPWDAARAAASPPSALP